MTQSPKVPDIQTRKRAVARLRESNRQLELVSLALDELIAMVEADLRCQQQERLQGKYRHMERKEV
ncbi:MAG: hypothetical protein JOZ78_14270 [Chroococcidiopsidaceae cyanobacterium CP_BM_ER_R8_30]|nr:hypothetical protein [Chroococcidiopsidaceae cyanobacterium CP_BM_ER_R8_30]